MLVEVETSKGQYQQQMVGSGAILKGYNMPAPRRSTLLLVSVYRDALTRAGWTIVRQIQSVNSADAVLNAHYSANGRDIRASLHGGGDSYTILVADVGAEDPAKRLDKECHIALYGIYFDFNKATLRPDSEPTLNKVLPLLQSRPDLKLENPGPHRHKYRARLGKMSTRAGLFAFIHGIFYDCIERTQMRLSRAFLRSHLCLPGANGLTRPRISE